MIADPMIIPTAERCDKLRQILFEWADQLATIRKNKPNLIPQRPTTFLLLSYPWLATDLVAADQKTSLERNQGLFSALGFDGQHVSEKIQEILARDKHLAECCPTPFQLAHYLDVNLITPLATAILNGYQKGTVDQIYDDFDVSTYHQGRFKRILLTHLFNFEMEGNSSAVGEIRIERIGPETIPRLLGESGFQAFLHPKNIGNCFLVEEEGASAASDTEWMATRRDKAIRFGELLQYYKDGVVYAGYSVVHFAPEWVNQIRKWGLFFLGSPRQIPYESGSKLYTMTAQDRSSLEEWWKLMRTPKISRALDRKTGELRVATYRAAEYYELSHERSYPVERLIALAIATESLFSPSDKGELKFRICQSAAQFIGASAEERTKIFESLRKMYDKRSALFHGSYDLKKYEEGEFVTHAQIDEWSGYIRRAYTGFLALYLRSELGLNGENSRESILRLIDEANFDDEKGVALRKRADVGQLVQEVVSHGVDLS